MPIAFSRSLRSLHADGRSRRAIWLLLIPVVVLAAWLLWFTRARVAQYETTNRAGTLDSQRVVAWFFASAALNRIHAGQPAFFRISGLGSFPARVKAVSRETPEGFGRVDLLLDKAARPLSRGMAGTVQVQVEFVSPARLLLRAAGLLL